MKPAERLTGASGIMTGAATPPVANTHPAAPPAPARLQVGANDFAGNSYVPLDCELPAGCGASGGASGASGGPSGVTREVAGSWGGGRSVHTSQGWNPTDDSDAPTNGPDPPNTHSDPAGTNSDPPNPGSNPTLAAAPELDPAALAGAVTLLLGALAVLRGRRAQSAVTPGTRLRLRR